jgi:hypothetical protein
MARLMNTVGYRNPYQRYNDYLNNSYSNGINWVQGVEGAKSFIIQPNEKVLLMDSEDDRLFVKMCDEIGKPSIRSFKLVEEVLESNEKVNMNEYVKKEEIQGMILDILGGISNGQGQVIQPNSNTEQKAEQSGAVANTNYPTLKL